jgi:hypothetical protein
MSSERRAVYAHDFASVPSHWVDVVDENSEWWPDHVLIRKQSQVFAVSREFYEDRLSDEALYALLRPQTWKEREASERHTLTVAYRVRAWWRGLRVRFAHWVADEFVGSDGWDP